MSPAPAALSPAKQLDSFIDDYSPTIAKLTRALLRALRTRFPGATVLVYDDYDALTVSFGGNERGSDAVLSLASHPESVRLYFNNAKALPDPAKVLKGTGKLVRYVEVPNVKALDEAPLKPLLAAALKNAKVKIPKAPKGAVVIKTVSDRSRPRRPGSK